MIPEYEKKKPARQEHITGLKFDKRKKRVIIRFNTYLYEISHPEDSYVVTWYRRTQKDSDKYTKDGYVECEDLAKVIQTIDGFLYAAFCPERASWWQLNDKPKHFSRNRIWG